MDNLEIFVATYKRPSIIKDTLENLLSQTAGGFLVTVLDNSSTSETADIMPPFLKHGVKYVKTSPPDTPFVNFKAAQALAEREYIILFHDDDMLHPQFIERAGQIIKRFKDIDIITGKCSNFYDRQKRPFPPELSKQVILLENKADTAAYFFAYGKGGANTPGTIYKTSYFKTADPLPQFHKNADWPFCIEAIKNGVCVIMDDNHAVHTRQHAGQDSHAAETNGSALNNLWAWFEYFAGILRPADAKSPYYKMWRIYAYNLLKGMYNYLKPSEKEKMPWPELLREAEKRNLLDGAAIKTGNYRKNLLTRLLTAPYRTLNKFKTRPVSIDK